MTVSKKALYKLNTIYSAYTNIALQSRVNKDIQLVPHAICAYDAWQICSSFSSGHLANPRLENPISNTMSRAEILVPFDSRHVRGVTMGNR